MPLHLTYRPQTLKEIVGNRETVAAIDALLARKKDVPHVWLFHGPPGTGKTTLARIISGYLKIEDMDLRELNIANLRGIDNARDIQEQMRFKPMGDGPRGWILDECHMGTSEFWNAMLKPLEDTPAHVYFFLCTTDSQMLFKRSAAIKRRCTADFRLEPLNKKQLISSLNDVIDSEQVSVPDEVIVQIAEESGGSMGQALAILDKIIDMEPEAMLAAARQVAAEGAESIELCRALIDGKNWTAIAAILSRLGEADIEKVRLAVCGYANAVLLKKDNPRAYVVLDAFREPFDRVGRPGLTWAAYTVIEGEK